MINRKILWLGGAGAAAVSIAIAITVNVVINKDTAIQTRTPGQLICIELQQAIDNLGRPGLNQLPQLVRDNIDWLRMRGEDCSLQGKNWSLVDGEIKRNAPVAQRPIIGDEKYNLNDW